MIFLDEPTSGLDSEMACQVMDSLISLARRDRLVRSPPSSIMNFRCGHSESPGSHADSSAHLSPSQQACIHLEVAPTLG